MNEAARFSLHPSSFILANMWNDRLRIAESVEGDWKALNAGERAAVRAALEIIDEDPIIGAPLFEPLRGLWSHRVGELRIVYRIVSEARFVVILAISRVPPRKSRGSA